MASSTAQAFARNHIDATALRCIACRHEETTSGLAFRDGRARCESKVAASAFITSADSNYNRSTGATVRAAPTQRRVMVG